MTSLLIADDDAHFWADSLRMALRSFGEFRIDTAPTVSACRAQLARRPYDLILLDISFGDPEDRQGIDLLPELRAIGRDAPIVMFSSLRDPSTVVRAKALGARDYIAKATDLHEICARLVSVAAAKDQADGLRRELSDIARECGAAFASTAMARAFQKVQIARRNRGLDVLITGEPGTGKEVIAAAIHGGRPRAPFIKVNCGAIAGELLESELFGHLRGSFTGAAGDKLGKFEAAHDGDIFLDEVGTLSDQAQIALLRVLENREITRVGANHATPIRTRVIAATNEDLAAKVAHGEFRADLLSRLRGFEIELAPLHRRVEDIEPIVASLVARSSYPSATIDSLCLEIFKAYPWPHNVRELRNVLHAALAVAGGRHVTVEHLSDEFIQDFERLSRRLAVLPVDASDDTGCEGDAYAPPTGQLAAQVTVELPLSLSLAEAERRCLTAFIRAKRSQLGEASQRRLAHALNIPRPTLSRRLKELGIN